MKHKTSLRSYLRCVISYNDISSFRVLRFAVSCDYVDEFEVMIKDTFVHPDIRFLDIIFSYDTRRFFQLV